MLRKAVDAELGPHAVDVEITTFDGLIVEFARQRQADFLVRGLRAYSDFEVRRARSTRHRCASIGC